MNKEIIAIDADEVLADTLPAFVNWVNKTHNKNFSYEEIKKNNQNLRSDTKSKEEWFKLVDGFSSSEDYLKISPVKGAIEAISILKEKYELFIITARPETVISETEKFVEEHFPDIFSGIHHTSNLKENKFIEKSEVCKKIGAKIIIDDRYKTAIDCAQKGIKAIVLDMPWNRNEDYSHENITHVKNWEEILEILSPKL